MANAIKWSAVSSETKVINGDTTAPTLKNLANNSQKLGNEVDNTSGRNQYGDFDFRCKFGTGPSATDARFDLYLVQAIDGSNYADGDDSVAPPGTAYAGAFPVRNVTTQQRVSLRGVRLPATKFKPLMINKTGQTTSNTDNENELYIATYNDEIQ